MRTFVPQLVVDQAGELDGAGQDCHRQLGRETFAVLPARGEHEQALGHHGRDQSEMRAARDDLPVQALIDQLMADHRDQSDYAAQLAESQSNFGMLLDAEGDSIGAEAALAPLME